MTNLTLVLGSTGKTGRRVVERLERGGIAVRAASRSGTSPFDWDDRSTCATVLDGASAVYISDFPDLADPVAAGEVHFPAETVPEPFVDVEDVQAEYAEALR